MTDNIMAGNIIVFLGPTLSVSKAQDILEAEYHPPAAQGDIYRAALRHPQAILLIDGYFGDVPAVTHKEILWALSQGIHVFGSSSMGALRATELHSFGMVGVGEVFAAFRDGELEDDDEVAISHGPAALNYPNLSESMVNIRWSLSLAKAEGIISRRSHDDLIALAKQQYYADRSYVSLLRNAQESGFDHLELKRLGAWLSDHKVDQKQQDAVALLKLLNDAKKWPQLTSSIKFSFEHTLTWDQLRHEALKDRSKS